MEETKNTNTSTDIGIAIAGNVDSGKCFAKGTKILMFDATSKNVEDIKVGDVLMGDDSNKRIVLETHSGIGQLYKIKFNNTSYEVNGEHILCLKYMPDDTTCLLKYNDKTYKYGDIVEISVNNYININPKYLKWYNTSLTFSENYHSITPYNMGYKLSNLNDISKFLFDSFTNRLDFLAGIIDSLGYYMDDDNCYYIKLVTNSSIISQVNFLIRSLGFTVYNIQQNQYTYIFKFYGYGQEYIPCRSIYTKKNYNSNNLCHDFTISKSDINNYYGFSIDKNHRFLLEDFSVCHNSSFIGVMFSGELDDGNGSARTKVARHNHEIKTGRTSDISTRIVECPNGKLITMIDLCGHERYLKTTTFGITSYYPDYGFVIIAANRGIMKMTKEHLGILFYMQIPTVFIVTRVDIAPENVYNTTIKNIKQICKMYNKTCEIISDYKDFHSSKEEIINKEKKFLNNIPEIANRLSQTSDYIPVITLSNKTGFFVEPTKHLVGQLKQRKLWDIAKFNNSIFYIESVFNPKGIGYVFSGITKGNPIKVGDTIYVGPYGKDFIPIKIKSIHNNNRQFVSELTNHQRGCIAVSSQDKNIELNRNIIQKGMIVIANPNNINNVCMRFNAKIQILHHSTMIKENYCPVIHVGPVRQAGRLLSINDIIKKEENKENSEVEKGLHTGDTAFVTFKFKYKPEFIEPKSIFFFREGTTRGVGEIINPIPLTDSEEDKPDPIRCKKRNKFIKKK
jgi:elongation factor 1-alpha